MEEIFQRLIDHDFSEVAGLTADVSIPVSEALANELIAVTLQGNKTLRSAQVAIHEQNQVSIRLKTSLLPWSLNLKLKLDRFVDLASFSSPKLRAWLENNRMLGSMAALFHALPEWIKLYGDQVVIDLGFFLQTPEQKKLFGLLKSVEISTEQGKAILDVRIRVDPEAS
jgi:hypothetical protein